MNPDAAALALASIEVDVSSIEQGQSIIAVWRGKPVFIRHRTEEEMKAAQEVPLDELKDPLARNANHRFRAHPATDENRATPGKEQWLVMVQVCTHLGCVPLGQQGDLRRLVLPLPRLALRYRRTHPPRARRRRTWRSRPSRSPPTPRSASAEAVRRTGNAARDYFPRYQPKTEVRPLVRRAPADHAARSTTASSPTRSRAT